MILDAMLAHVGLACVEQVLYSIAAAKNLEFVFRLGGIV